MNPAFWDYTINSHNHLSVAGCDLVDLADRFGTPLHIVHKEALVSDFQSIRETYQRYYPNTRVFYSYKTNPIPGMLALLHKLGCGAEVVSPYELWLARRLGLASEQIIYNGVHKPRSVLRAAIEAGSLINIDSVEEGAILSDVASEMKRAVNVGVRVSPRVGWRVQFGVEAETGDLVSICERMKSNTLCNVCGLSAHIGTAIRTVRGYVNTIRWLCQLAGRIQKTVETEITCLDIGGGFGVPTVKAYSRPEMALYWLLQWPPRPPKLTSCPSTESFARSITSALRQESARAGLNSPTLMLEPGRAISSRAQTLLVRVREIKKRRNGRIYAITDGGTQHLGYPVTYEYHHCFVASRADAKATKRYFVVGPLCSPADILYRNWPLPELSKGDVLAVMDAGAYFTSFANNFSFPRPPIALVADGECMLIRKGETFEHVASLDSDLTSE